MSEITDHGRMEGQMGIWKLKTSCVPALSAVTHWGAFLESRVKQRQVVGPHDPPLPGR